MRDRIDFCSKAKTKFEPKRPGKIDAMTKECECDDSQQKCNFAVSH